MNSKLLLIIINILNLWTKNHFFEIIIIIIRNKILVVHFSLLPDHWVLKRGVFIRIIQRENILLVIVNRIAKINLWNIIAKVNLRELIALLKGMCL